MQLDPDIEALFGQVPALARLPRDAWVVTPLGGITNRSYRLEGEGADLVLRWPGESASRYLDRQAEAENAAAVAAIGLAPDLVAADAAAGWYLTTFATGARPLSKADFADPLCLGEVADLLTRLHRSDIRFPFQQGLFQAIDLYLDLAPTPLMRELRVGLEPARVALARQPGPRVPSHIDPNPANFLRRRDGGLLLIDWEFAAMEEQLWDLAAIALEAGLPEALEQAVLLSHVGEAAWPRFELYKSALLLVAASWCEMEIVGGNESPDLVALRDDRVRRLKARLGDPRFPDWLGKA
jgi:thiamine kinase-like enzyme